MEGLIAFGTLAVGGVFVGLIIWADRKGQAAYDRWYDDPQRIWNQHRSM